ncbi:MAG: peptidylprolyl isomerase [Planctomycetes bacterium]|nr:peptidylprolyl isomerase [Planctomycetota bacterium]
MSRLATTTLCLALLCGGAAATRIDEPQTDAVGSIDGVAVPRAEFEHWLVEVFGPPNLAAFLEERAIAAGAAKLGFAPKPESIEAAVEAEWQFVTRERFGNDEAAYLKELATIGHSKASFRAARSRAIASDLAIEACARAARATDDPALTSRLSEFYGDPPTRRVVRGILVDRRREHAEDAPADVTDERTRRTAAAKARAEKALARLAAGDSFADVARAFSDHASASNGGLLEPYRPTTFGGSVDATITAFKTAGERSAILETRVGYVIVELVSVEEATMPKVRDELTRLVLDESIMPDEREAARRKLLAQVELATTALR